MDVGAISQRNDDSSRVVVGGAIAAYYARVWRRLGFIAALIVAVLALMLLSALVGGSSFTMGQSWDGIWSWFGADAPDTPDAKLIGTIVWQLRMPRILTAIVAGAGLTVAGLLMQTILRNPLASPTTLGIASAASTGAAMAIIFKSSVLSFLDLRYDYVIIANAFLFAAACTAIIYLLTRLQRVTPETIILLGVAMMFFFSALTAFIQYLGNPEEMAELSYWMFGTLNKATWSKLWITTGVIGVGLLIAYRWIWDLNALAADDDSATSAGVNVARLRLRALALSSLLTAVCVAFLGPIGFIGLVAPHLGRILVGGDHRFLLPISTLIGAILLLGADTVARTIAAPRVIPVGIITAFVGVPVLIFLMLRRRADHW